MILRWLLLFFPLAWMFGVLRVVKREHRKSLTNTEVLMNLMCFCTFLILLSLLVGGCATTPLEPVELTEVSIQELPAPSPAAQRDAQADAEGFDTVGAILLVLAKVGGWLLLGWLGLAGLARWRRWYWGRGKGYDE